MSKPQGSADAGPQQSSKSIDAWKQVIWTHIRNRGKDPLREVIPALNAYPTDADLLLTAALAALLEERPDQSLRYQKRFSKHYYPAQEFHLLHALALAQYGRWSQAEQLIRQHRLQNINYAARHLPCAQALRPWIVGWFNRIELENGRLRAPQEKARPKPPSHGVGKTQLKHSPGDNPGLAIPTPRLDTGPVPSAFALPQLPAQISVSFTLPEAEEIIWSGEKAREDLDWFRLRFDLAHLSLLQGFDELLCLSLLHNVDTYWYQLETVRKVLKQFRGRVLLADEVGLGKTIEAGMVLKEYMMRGMVERVLILTPATMVGQWLEEMVTKFDIQFASSYDSLARINPAAFWEQPRVIASIATARRPEHSQILNRQVYDMVIADEAHHLKNRATQNWKLVNALQKRFLLLLSATPVQNSLVELYNLLTLLKPGIFKTQKEFCSTYMTPGKPRVPANRDQMRDLMRDVMIRNTRSLVDVRLPPRHAITLRLDAGPEETACYQELSRLVGEVHQSGPSQHRLALRHLLSAAGSSPAAAARAIHRFSVSARADQPWIALHQRYEALSKSCKEAALGELLKRNPDEKKMVFLHQRETLARIADYLDAEGWVFSRFEGSMSGPEKDSAVEQFRDGVPILLCTESGGEGRNLQFCNTLINYDLPWNPMAIEQRIGRLHRIGQKREVFVFNLVVQNTLEEYVLKILDEKINMFQLVVGEIDAILGEMEDSQEFAEMVFAAWVETTEQERPSAFDTLGERIVKAKRQYEAVKVLDEELFGDEFVTG
jgi:SNF2 family DNA or RNA helicase